MDPELKDQRDSEARKAIRVRNRNRKANYGRRKAVVFTTNPTTRKRGGLTVTPR